MFAGHFHGEFLSRFALQRTRRCAHVTHIIFRESAGRVPQFGRGAGANHLEHPRAGDVSCEGFIMLKHIAQIAVLAFVIMPMLTSAAPARDKPMVEVVFVLDTTGSMGPLIEGAKRKIWSIATTLIDCSPEADIRMGLVVYRDIGDEYVTRRFDLTTDIQGLYADLLRQRATGGGDWPESVNEALHVAVTRMSWTQGSNVTRLIFLVGDAPPHMDYAQDMKYPDVMRLARERGIKVNAVQAGSARDTERVWREIAQMGHGEYIPIPQDGGKVAVIESPYDREIIELQGRINRTVLPYGSPTQQEGVRGRVEQYSAAPAPVANDMAGFMAKRAQRPGQALADAVTGAGDLVGDVANGRQSLSAVPEAQLPDDLRRMSPAERRAHVDRQVNERRALNERLAELVRQRDRHVAEARSREPQPATDSFDRAVERTLRQQLAR
jgi:hypothetical protein